MASNTNHVDPADKSASIPLEEMTSTRRANANTRDTRDNIGVDDGLLDEDPKPAGPDVNEPGEVDELEPGGRREPPHQPPPHQPRPTPGPRPEFPRKPEEPRYYPDPNVNNGINYTTKKNIAQGMMDIALLTANVSQLRYVMRSPYWDVYHQVNIVLISISIALQIIAGIMLVFISRYDFKRKEDRNITQTLSDIVVIFIFTITVVNIFIAAFGVDDERTTFLRWKQQSTDASSEPLFSTVTNISNNQP